LCQQKCLCLKKFQKLHTGVVIVETKDLDGHQMPASTSASILPVPDGLAVSMAMTPAIGVNKMPATPVMSFPVLSSVLNSSDQQLLTSQPLVLSPSIQNIATVAMGTPSIATLVSAAAALASASQTETTVPQALTTLSPSVVTSLTPTFGSITQSQGKAASNLVTVGSHFMDKLIALPISASGQVLTTGGQLLTAGGQVLTTSGQSLGVITGPNSLSVLPKILQLAQAARTSKS